MKKMTNSMPEYVENDKEVFSEKQLLLFEETKSLPETRIAAEEIKKRIFNNVELNEMFKTLIIRFNVKQEELDVFLIELISYRVVFLSWDINKFMTDDFETDAFTLCALGNRLRAHEQKNIVDKIINDFYEGINKVKASLKKHGKSDHEIASIIFESVYGWCEPDENGRLVKVKGDPIPNAEQFYIEHVMLVFNYGFAGPPSIEFIMNRVKDVFRNIFNDTGIKIKIKIN